MWICIVPRSFLAPAICRFRHPRMWDTEGTLPRERILEAVEQAIVFDCLYRPRMSGEFARERILGGSLTWNVRNLARHREAHVAPVGPLLVRRYNRSTRCSSAACTAKAKIVGISGFLYYVACIARLARKIILQAWSDPGIR